MSDFLKGLQEQQEEEERWRDEQRSKCGDYTNQNCTNCGRERVMLGSDGKHRCEKCSWVQEDNERDFDLVHFLAGSL